MSYENAPATVLLATHCACCGRPLVDAVSVEAGMGPHCRAKHGYLDQPVGTDWTAAQAALALADLAGAGPWLANPAWNLDARVVANALVHRIAATQDSGAPLTIARLCDAVQALGFPRLAETLLKRYCPVVVRKAETGDRLLVKTPYSPAFVGALKAAHVGAGFDKESKRWVVPATLEGRTALWAALKAAFKGVQGSGPSGAFVVA